MGEEKTYTINDTNRSIGRLIEDLQKWDSSYCDPRVKAIIVTKLQEAQLWSLVLIKEQK